MRLWGLKENFGIWNLKKRQISSFETRLLLPATLISVIFLLHKNIIFGHIFDDLVGSMVGGKSDICVCFVSKVKLSSSLPPKKK